MGQLQERLHRLYGLSLKELVLDEEGFLVDEQGIRYKRNSPIGTVDIKDGEGVRLNEVNEIRRQILNLNPQPHGFLRVKHPNSSRLAHRVADMLLENRGIYTLSAWVLPRLEDDKLKEGILKGKLKYLELNIALSEKIDFDFEIREVEGSDFDENYNTIRVTRDAPVFTYRLEFYHLGE